MDVDEIIAELYEAAPLTTWLLDDEEDYALDGAWGIEWFDVVREKREQLFEIKKEVNDDAEWMLI